ncbi:MAG: hypothetical protein R3C15_20800 [Thermoleophilia bacterium]
MTISVPSSPAGAFTLGSTIGDEGAGLRAHAGVCNLDAVPTDQLAAEALVVGQGCKVGRTLRARTSSDVTLPGEIWAYTIDGSPVKLVPVGTVVDLVANLPG